MGATDDEPNTNTDLCQASMSPSESTNQGCPRPRLDDNNTLWVPSQIVNPHIICGLCQGYLYEACTITECMHSFCKSCIVKHLLRSLNCPMCAILIHPTDPFVHIRLDGLLQDIVYALLPHVEKEEIERERKFYEVHEDDRVHRRELKKKESPPVKQGSDQVSKNIPSEPLPPPFPSQKFNNYIPPVSLCLECLDSEVSNPVYKLNKHYVRVTGAATIKSLTAFLRLKLNMEDSTKVDLYCPCRSGMVSLSSGHTLKAVKDLYSYNQDILHLRYDVNEQ